MTRIRDHKATRSLAAAMLLALGVVMLLGTQPAPTRATTAAGDQYADSGDAASTLQESFAASDESAAADAAGKSAQPVLPQAPAQVAAPAAAVPAITDTTPPAVSGLTPANGSFTGPMPVISYDFSDPSGALWPDGVHLYIDNRCSRTLPGTTDISSSNLTYTPAAPLSEGPHRLKAFLCDNLFNCGTTQWNITVDASAPRITAVSPTGSLSSGDATIEAAYNDGSGAGVHAAGVRVSLDGSDITGACSVTTTGLSCAANGLSQGTHQVSITVPDLVGLSADSSWSFSVDTSSVGVTGQTPAPGSWQNSARPVISASFQPAASGTVDPGALSVRVDGADMTHLANAGTGGFSLTPVDPLGEGAHSIEVQIADDAGHSGVGAWSFSIDSEMPRITGRTPAGAAGSAMPLIQAAFQDALSGVDPASVRLTIDGEDVTAAATYDAFGISYTPHHGLAGGSHSVQLDVTDYAGNRRVETWSFTVAASAAPAQPGSGAPAVTPVETRIATTYSYVTTLFSPGRWSLSGVTSQPNTYFFPWYEPAAGTGQSADIIIRNKGAGEAFVSLFISGDESWSGKVPEGGEVAVPPLSGNGPIKVICPTGQHLEASLRLAGDGWQATIAGVSSDTLSPVWMLPWYEGGEPGVSSRIAIGNAGAKTAEVDVYIGDSLLPESLKGHFSISPDTAAMAEFPGVSGGLVKVVSTNGEPLVVGQVSRFQGSLSLTPAATPRQLDSDYAFGLASFADAGRQWLAVANPNPESVEFAVKVGGEAVPAADGETFRLQPEQSLLLPLEAGGETVEVSCRDCGFGRGLVTGWRAQAGSRYSEAVVIPATRSLWD
ncbi:MAG: hypothetical protein C4534_06430 [Gaiellales bacterium]|nr:MAG: hypothetical protein C4534_06430 [Gaiellales bacterium]